MVRWTKRWFDLRILSSWLDNLRSRSEGEKGRPRLVVKKDAVFFFSVIYAISMEVAMMFEFLRDLVYILVSDIVFESSYLSVICWRRSESQISIAGAIPS